MKKILAVVAHPDDEIIGVGGTLRKRVKNGDEVYILILGDGKTSRIDGSRSGDNPELYLSHEESTEAAKRLGVQKVMRLDLPDNKFDSMPLLDVIKRVAKVVEEIRPDVVFTHHYGDLNIDHRITHEAVITICRPIEHPVEQILLFETLSSTEMAGPVPARAFLPNHFVDITDELEDKLRAMSAYRSELRDYPHPRSLEAIRNNALGWGSKINRRAAEAFILFRGIEI